MTEERRTSVRPQGEWETQYAQQDVESMPWFYEPLDHDVERALDRLGLTKGRILDLGTGPGTQAIALAKRGFDVTASDLSPTAVAKAEARAAKSGASVRFVADDVLASRLEGPFDLVLDRGCFHTLPPECRGDYVATLARIVAPSGLAFLKTFSVKQPGEQGPFRFSPEKIRELFEGPFDVRSIDETVYHGTLDPLPIALFTVLARR